MEHDQVLDKWLSPISKTTLYHLTLLLENG